MWACVLRSLGQSEQTRAGALQKLCLLDIFYLHNSYLNKMKQFKYFLIIIEPASDIIAIEEWQSFFGVTDKS